MNRRARVAGKLLRVLPPGFPGKYRVGRRLLGARSGADGQILMDRQGNRLTVPNLQDAVGFHLWADGEYEADVLQACARRLQPSSTVLDVGANVGVLTLGLARLVPQGRVFAFEASPQVLPILEWNVAANDLKNVTIVPCAASIDETDAVQFYVPPVSHFGMGSSAPQFGVTPVRVRACSIDRVLAAHGTPRVDLIKVDVEGFEAHVFVGASRLLASSPAPAIVFEFNDWAEERAFPGRGGWAQSVLRDHGYDIWTLADYLAQRAPLRQIVKRGGGEFVAIKPNIS